MNLVEVTLTTLGSIVVMFILSKIMGNRQMSQLSMFDYINGITIGSIAAEMATAIEEFEKPLTAMILYGLVAVAISVLNDKSIKIRRFVTGIPVILYENGKIYEKNMAKVKLDVNEFLTQCRNAGYFDLNNIHTAILETNGKISFMPIADQRPVTPQDLNLSPSQDTPLSNVIIDGKIMPQNLRHTGNNEVWLKKQLQAQDVHNESEVFLATCDANNKLSVYKKSKKPMKRDIFE